MDDKYQEILKALPESSPRSCLDPFREFIGELRRRGRTYREVAYILANYCNIQVSVSTVFRFLHSRGRTKSHPRSHHFAKVPEMTKEGSNLPSKATPHTNSEKADIAFDEIWQRIADLKSRQVPTETAPKLFDYDPDQPLHLRKKTSVSQKP
jgi:IS30 family transposase